MKKLVFLVSTGGGTLKFIDQCIQRKILKNFSIEAVIADRECPALNFARQQKIKNYLIEYTTKKPQALHEIFNKLGCDFIITNINKIIDADLVRKYSGRMLNLHYSILPAFKGFNAVKKALKEGCKFIGTTTHYVDEYMDNGKIISQSVLPVPDERPEFDIVMDKVFRAGCINLLNSIFILSNMGETEASCACFQTVTFSPPLCFRTEVFDENFWQLLKKI